MNDLNILVESETLEQIPGRLRKDTAAFVVISAGDGEKVKKHIGPSVLNVDHDYAAKRSLVVSEDLSEIVSGMYKGASFDILVALNQDDADPVSMLVMTVERQLKSGLVSFLLQ